MSNQDENAWVREFEKVERTQEKRKTVTFSGGYTYEIPRNIYTGPNKDDSNDE